MAKTVGMISLGCPKNQVDAEIMLKKLVDAAYILVDEAENVENVIEVDIRGNSTQKGI
jgi:ribosomal protein S12 methylthiotransferase